LSPEVEWTSWLLGREYAGLPVDSFEVVIAFDRTIGKSIVFDIEITNNSSKSILVSPEEFYYIPMRSLDDRDSSLQIFAFNPENELLEIDKKVSRENASYASATATDAIFAVLELAEDIAAPNQGDLDEEIQEGVAREINRNEQEQTHHARVTNLSDLRAEWEMQALRKTTVDPDYQIRGRLHFPVTKNARFLRLSIPVGENRETVLFKQIEHQAN
jgi:hypothetical protein